MLTSSQTEHISSSPDRIDLFFKYSRKIASKRIDYSNLVFMFKSKIFIRMFVVSWAHTAGHFSVYIHSFSCCLIRSMKMHEVAGGKKSQNSSSWISHAHKQLKLAFANSNSDGKIVLDCKLVLIHINSLTRSGLLFPALRSIVFYQWRLKCIFSLSKLLTPAKINNFSIFFSLLSTLMRLRRP